MAKSKKNQALGRVGRVEREQRNIRIVQYSMLGVILITILAVVVGGIMEFVITPKQPVATVNGIEITTEEYQTRIRYERTQVINVFMQYYQIYQFTQDQNLGQQLQFIASQLETDQIATDAFQTMIDDVLIAQAAEEMGISVSDEEIEKEIEVVWGYFPDGSPTPTNSPTIEPTSTLSATQLAIITLTPTPADTSTPTITVEPTENLDVTATPTAGQLPTLTPTIVVTPPTPTPFTFEAFQDAFATEMANLQTNSKVSEAAFKDILGKQLLREKVFAELTKDVPIVQEHIWVRHIVVNSEELANDVIGLLEDGEAWTRLVLEVSIDNATLSRGGDLGWQVNESINQSYVPVISGMEIGDISAPIEIEDPSSESGTSWAIIQLLGKEDRSTTPNLLNAIKQNLFTEWLEGLRAEADIIESDDWLERAPNEPSIPTG